MSTKTIFIDNPEDWRAGDWFTGVRDGITMSGPLKKSLLSSLLYLHEELAYVTDSRWTDVKVTRQVEEAPKYLDFAVGSVVKNKGSNNRYYREEDGWFGVDSGFEFSLEEMDETIQIAEVFERAFLLVRGPQPTPRKFAHKDAVQVGDTVRTNGKGGAYEAGYEFVVTEIVEQESLIPNLNTNIYYRGDEKGYGIWSTFVDKVK